jgi:hypothetical protein
MSRISILISGNADQLFVGSAGCGCCSLPELEVGSLKIELMDHSVTGEEAIRLVEQIASALAEWARAARSSLR